MVGGRLAIVARSSFSAGTPVVASCDLFDLAG
jgi:hypothetical protein